jgi:hypothetical protein
MSYLKKENSISLNIYENLESCLAPNDAEKPTHKLVELRKECLVGQQGAQRRENAADLVPHHVVRLVHEGLQQSEAMAKLNRGDSRKKVVINIWTVAPGFNCRSYVSLLFHEPVFINDLPL